MKVEPWTELMQLTVTGRSPYCRQPNAQQHFQSAAVHCSDYRACFGFYFLRSASQTLPINQLIAQSSKHNNKKLRCRREIARCFVSLNISLSHSRSLKVIRNQTRVGCVYVPICIPLLLSLSCTVSEIAQTAQSTKQSLGLDGLEAKFLWRWPRPGRLVH